MRPVRRDGLFGALRTLLPLLLTLLLVLLSAVPTGLPGFAAMGPDVALISVYYWTIHRPDLLSAGGAFAVGLLVDLLSGGPPGANALVLVLVQIVTLSQRPALAGKTFGVTWLGFAVIAVGASILLWLVTCLWALQVLDPSPGLLRLGLGVLAFPLYALAVDELQRRLLSHV